MGEIADYYEMLNWGYVPPRRERYQQPTGKGKWRSAEGVIDMSDMTERHLRNAIDFCDRNNDTNKKAELIAELESRNHPIENKESSMQSHQIVAALQATQGVKTVKVRFPTGPKTLYTYKTTLDLQPSDLVVVEARDSYAVVEVAEIDAVPDVLDTDYRLRWVVQKVDIAFSQQMQAHESQLIRQINLAEAKRRLEETAQALGLDTLGLPALPAVEDAEVIEE